MAKTHIVFDICNSIERNKINEVIYRTKKLVWRKRIESARSDLHRYVAIYELSRHYHFSLKYLLLLFLLRVYIRGW